jgi:formamidopyrimidine-DNA glycosylase
LTSCARTGNTAGRRNNEEKSDFMIELPEAFNLSNQLNDTVSGKRIAEVTGAHTPHKLAWYYGDPSAYSDLLVGKTVDVASPFGSMVEMKAEDANILFGEGVNIRLHDKVEKCPANTSF